MRNIAIKKYVFLSTEYDGGAERNIFIGQGQDRKKCIDDEGVPLPPEELNRREIRFIQLSPNMFPDEKAPENIEVHFAKKETIIKRV